MNFGRTFRFRERMGLEIRAEFSNVFNRTQIGNPITAVPGSLPSKNLLGQYAAGFGVINLTVSGPNQAPTYTQNAAVGQLYTLPRNGTLIARFQLLKLNQYRLLVICPRAQPVRDLVQHLGRRLVRDLARSGRVVTAAAVCSRRSPIFIFELRLRIDLPMAKTVFCCFSPQRTWMDSSQSGNKA